MSFECVRHADTISRAPLSPVIAPEAIDHAPAWLRPSRDLDGYRAKKTVSMLKQ